jgi:hypothetical protein
MPDPPAAAFLFAAITAVFGVGTLSIERFATDNALNPIPGQVLAPIAASLRVVASIIVKERRRDLLGVLPGLQPAVVT